MDSIDLLNNVIAYGADEDGIRDRFGDNAQLYENCLRWYFEEPSFALLDEAMKAGDYEKAFSSAHTLKGVSGNLGLTASYEALCALVEALRAKQYERAGEEYALVKRSHENLVNAFALWQG